MAFVESKKIIANHVCYSIDEGNRFFIANVPADKKILIAKSFCSFHDFDKFFSSLIHIPYNDILKFELVMDNEVYSSGTLSGAIIGGMLSGEAGAVVGGIAGKTQKTRTESVSLILTTVDLSIFTIPFAYDNRVFEERKSTISWWSQFLSAVEERNRQINASPTRELNTQQAGTVPCPVCAERIRPEAKKCRFCGEILDGMSAENDRRHAAGPETVGTQKYSLLFRGEVYPIENQGAQQAVLQKMAAAAGLTCEQLMRSETAIRNLSKEKATAIQERLERQGVKMHIVSGERSNN